MKSRNLLLTVALGAAVGASAQNWTATDIDGTTHTLQDYLDQGKTVMVDISAHWCGPCWSWHTGGVMERLYHEFGPDGTDDMIIFWIDGDQTSTLAEIQGQGSTQGDWTVGTDYPIIGPNGEGGAVANNYSFPGYPTLFIHTPANPTGVEIDRAGFWDFLSDWRGMASDAWVNGVNDATVVRPLDTELCPGESPFGILYNQGSAPLTSATLELKQGGSVLETLNWTGNLAPDGHMDVSFTSTAVSSAQTFDIEVSMPNGVADDHLPGAEESIDYAVAADVTYGVEVEIITDNYGAETYWRILDPAGAVAAEGGNLTMGPAGAQGLTPPADPNSYSNGTTNTIPVYFTQTGCHTFEIYDYYGDGICCAYGDGSFTVKDINSGTTVISGGTFAAEAKGKSNNNAVGVTEFELAAENLNVFPNPTTGVLNVQTTLEGSDVVNVSVLNLLGEQVMAESFNTSTGVQNNTMDLSELDNGIYYVNVIVGERSSTRKVTLNK